MEEHKIQDYGMEFENIVIKFFGRPKTPIYFASYYSDNFETKAMLFSICVQEININKDKYSQMQIEELTKFEQMLRKDCEHSTVMRCIEYLREI